MEKKTVFPHAAWIVTLVYFLKAAVCVGCFLIGIRSNNALLDIGMFLCLTWMINPTAFIFLFIELITSRPKWFFIACMAATTLCWIVAGMLIAPYF